MQHRIPETVVVVTDPLEGDALQWWEPLIRAAAALHPKRLVIDLRDSPRIDPAGIVLLLQVHRQMVCADGQLTLRSPAVGMRKMLSFARVDRVLETEDPAGETVLSACRRPRRQRTGPATLPGQRRPSNAPGPASRQI